MLHNDPHWKCVMIYIDGIKNALIFPPDNVKMHTMSPKINPVPVKQDHSDCDKYHVTLPLHYIRHNILVYKLLDMWHQWYFSI